MHFTSLPLAVSGIDLALAGLVSGVILGALGMYFQHRRQAMWHETAKLALEKGQPVPCNGCRTRNGWHCISVSSTAYLTVKLPCSSTGPSGR